MRVKRSAIESLHHNICSTMFPLLGFYYIILISLSLFLLHHSLAVYQQTGSPTQVNHFLPHRHIHLRHTRYNIFYVDFRQTGITSRYGDGATQRFIELYRPRKQTCRIAPLAPIRPCLCIILLINPLLYQHHTTLPGA